MSRILDWAREPTTLQGFGLLAGAAVASWLGVDSSVSGVLASIAIPLLVPQKPELQRAASLIAGAAITEIGRHALTARAPAPASTDEPKAPT